MDFDPDDPIGDLLSDGSNDSFFDERPKRNFNKSPTKKSTATPSNLKTKSSIDDLFGFKSDEKTVESTKTELPKTNNTDSAPTSGPTSLTAPKTPTAVKTKVADIPKPVTPLQKTTTFDNDDDDVLSDLGFDPKRPKSKSTVLEEILGISEKEVTKLPVRPKTNPPTSRDETVASRPKTAVVAPKNVPTQQTLTTPRRPLESATSFDIPTPSMSRQSTFASDTTTASDGTVVAPNPVRRTGGRRTSAILNDPLGLFAKQDETKKSEEPKKQLFEVQPQEPKSLPTPTPAPRIENFLPQQPASIIPNTMSTLDNRAQMLAISAVETESAISALKQQEIQLAITGQMKNQEVALTEMQKRQQDLLRQQEMQFNDLLQKQLQRQMHLEEVIKSQHERINSHIQLLMTQPATSYSNVAPDIGYSTTVHNVLKKTRPDSEEGSMTDEDKSETDFKTEIKQLELEKLRLEELLSNVNTNHEQELSFIEQSHKKQIKLLEQALEKTEERLKAENKSLQEYYFGKIGDLENEKLHIIEESKRKLQDLKEEYESTVSDLKKKYENEVQTMEQHYKDMISSIRQSKLLEFAVVQDNSNYLETLKSAHKTLETANDELQGVREMLGSKIDDVYSAKQAHLEAREKKVEQMEQFLNKSREAAEKEKIQLLELVKNLEIKLASMEQVSSEENWNTKQKLLALEVEKAAFEREKTFVREQQQREQKRIDDLRQIHADDYDRQMKQIEEERMNLITEKAKVETNLRLQKRAESGSSSRAEIEAAIKVAEEAGRQSDIERERLIEVQKQYENKRRLLMDKEATLRAKEIEMEEAIKAAQGKEKIADKAVNNARALEKSILLKLQTLQKHARDLKEREARLSRDKITLSRERLETEALVKKTQANRCSLCKIGEKSMKMTNAAMNEPINGDDNLFKDSIDFDIEASLEKLRSTTAWDELQEINLDHIPSFTGLPENFIDSDLQLLKFDALNFSPNA